MNKKEFVNYYAENYETTKKDASEIVDNMLEAVTDVLASGDNISIVGFGTLGTKERAGRMGRNPQTGEEIEIPARTAAFFKAGKGLKERVNE